MNTQAKYHSFSMFVVATAFALAVGASAFAQAPVGSAFTYQAKLSMQGQPLTGTADFVFTLWDAPTEGQEVVEAVSVSDVGVVDGIFILNIPFAVEAYVPYEARWLQVAVRSPAGVGQFTTLTPRQELTATAFSSATRGINVDPIGRVGIGTAKPQRKLHVEGDLWATGEVRIGNSISIGSDAHAGADDITSTSHLITFYDTNVVTDPGTNPSIGWIGVRELAPYRPLHVINTDIAPNFYAQLWEEDAVVEDTKAWLGLYSREPDYFTSGITLGDVGTGQGDKWSIFRRDVLNSTELRLTFTIQVDPADPGAVDPNERIMTILGDTRDIYLAQDKGNVAVGFDPDLIPGRAPYVGMHVARRGGYLADYDGFIDGTEDIIVEDSASAWIGLYSDSTGSIGSGIAFAEISDDPDSFPDNKWAIYRRITPNVGDLNFTFGDDENPGANPKILQLKQDGNVLMGTSTLGGRLGIGTSAPTAPLDVNGTARLRDMPEGDYTPVRVDDDGVLYRLTSSLRYKTNIRALPSEPAAVLNLRPVGFDWRSTGESDVGLIAEEVAEVLPELVVRDSMGRPEAVHYDKVAVYLLEVVKSQQKRIAVLEETAAQNRQLQARIEALEQAVGQRSAGAEQNRSVQP